MNDKPKFIPFEKLNKPQRKKEFETPNMVNTPRVNPITSVDITFRIPIKSDLRDKMEELRHKVRLTKSAYIRKAIEYYNEFVEDTGIDYKDFQ